MVENIVFYCLVGEGQPGRKSSLGSTFFILPNREEKAGEKSALIALLHKCPLSSTLIHDLMTLSPAHLMTFTHKSS